MRLGFGLTPNRAYRDMILMHMLPDTRAEQLRA